MLFRSDSLAVKKYNILHRCSENQAAKEIPAIDISTQFQVDNRITPEKYTEKEIIQALAVVGKTSATDELNCSGCGYDSCREFAKALLAGRAEENMCVSYMRKIAHDKANVLLQKIPAGVILVNSELKIADMNRYTTIDKDNASTNINTTVFFFIIFFSFCLRSENRPFSQTYYGLKIKNMQEKGDNKFC